MLFVEEYNDIVGRQLYEKIIISNGVIIWIYFCWWDTVYAQNLHQNVPHTYRGTWKLAKSSWSWKGESKTLVVKSRYVKHPVFTLGGRRLGVHVGKKYVSLYQLNSHGKRAGENFILGKARYKGHAAIHVIFDTASQYYVRK
ncbi:hypothetical protein HC026_00710 [Lactobacillus sp. LC28-10]|uniref:Uncharacterized protein n=1 Tax=Secundilactobacillus angelensis TaxID=2722706 RepID=A0ABX1KWN0_9LACO|nr:hypothetical protein [Secundilactobacillus angelensis]MCH5461945.1 hypothetical protein [Secundilactobacillus angelensis]NLR17433.1 hypothetical protein [Secundilactobacillus angelensis]